MRLVVPCQKPIPSPRRFSKRFGSAIPMRPSMDKLEIKATHATINVTDAGEIVGNAWSFGSADSVGDIITKGAFNFIATDLPVLFGHNPDDLIGTWTETAETLEGLVVKGKLHMDQPRARTVLRMIKNKL